MLKIPRVPPLKYLRNVVSRVPPRDLCGSWCVETYWFIAQGYRLVPHCTTGFNAARFWKVISKILLRLMFCRMNWGVSNERTDGLVKQYEGRAEGVLSGDGSESRGQCVWKAPIKPHRIETDGSPV